LFRLDVSQDKLRKQRTIKAGEALARMSDELGDTPMLNVRSQGIHCQGREFSPDEVDNLYLYFSRGELNWPKQLTKDTFITLAADTPFDPVQIYIGNLKAKPLPNEQWERLDKWLFNLDDAITARFMQRFAVAAIARVFQPGCLVRQMPVLLGAQGIGKTQLGRALFSDEFYGDGISSRMDVDDETLVALTWGCEFSEFDGYTRKASVEKLKAFISRTTALCRRKYGKGTIRIPRRSVFWGTANRSPLVDRTGSTRFCLIPLPGEKLPVDRVLLDRDAFWARALIAYRQGFQSFSTDEELDEIISRNAGYDMPDPWEELIRDIVLRRSGAAYIELQDVYRELDIGAERQNGQNAKRITELMADLGWPKARRRIDGQRVNAFFPPSTSGQAGQCT
jgi:predicted P-loop ATPase